ncbi:MAG: HAD hydrolase family protein [Planctomycetota bacterium]
MTTPPDPQTLARLRLLLLDFDGVMTDGLVYLDQEGKETVVCSRRDGLGIERLRDAGIAVAVISREKNLVVARRCEKLQIPCHQGIRDKIGVAKSVASEFNIDPGATAFMGDDVIDLEPMAWCALGIAPADAIEQVLREADWVTQRKGGRGAVREVADAILDARAAIGR